MKELGTDSRGNFKRFIGGHTFYLGTGHQEAQIRNLRLEQLWAKVKDHAGWDEIALMVGKAIARGDTEITVAPSSLGTFATMERMAQLQADYPMIHFVPSSDREIVAEEQRHEAARLRWEANIREYGMVEGLPFHKALDQFVEKSIKLDRIPGTDELTDSALRIIRNVKILKEHHKEFPLSELNLEKIDTMLAYWANRPIVKKTGKPGARVTCREQIKIFRRFLRWASRAGIWHQPNGYAVTPIRFRTLPAEYEAKATAEQVQRYKRGELVTLYQYARPLERLFMLLALNCGFGQREICTLRRREVGEKFIKRIRQKSGVYGEWMVWPETLAALDWYQTYFRPASEAPELILTKKGTPLASRSAAGNRNMAVANAWSRLLDRVAKDHSEFGPGKTRRLSFNKLRKTAGNLIRRSTGGEIQKTFLCHGKPVKDDPLSEVYSNRVFSKVFRALKKVHRHLDQMFAAVPNPFPAIALQPALSLGTVRRIKTMKAQGFRLVAIARELGISRETVRKYAN